MNISKTSGPRSGDFHQLIHEVRLAHGDADTEHSAMVGTTLTLFEDELYEDLWSDDVHVVPVAERPRGNPGSKSFKKGEDSAKRRARIFLDLVAFESADLESPGSTR